MEDTEILEMVSGYADSVSIAGMEVCAVAVILFAIGCIVGAVVFDILSKRWHT
jgi:hypothetical protein